ncbi:MAG: hypothetical protein JNL25_00175, partial [Rhodospirillaceae bacterium]|nr:hypothetical protein [Rhodospirillaceae bacterium]
MNEPATSPTENDETVRAAPGKPVRKGGFWRFLRRLIGSLAVLLFVVLGSALLFRLDLVNRFGAPLLTESLSTPTELALSALEWRRARIDHLQLGSDGALSLDGIELAYDPLGTRLERVEIDRVTLAVNYDSGFSLGELDPLIARLRELAGAGSGDPEAPSTPLPTVIVKSIEVALMSPAGLIRGDGRATLDNEAVIASFDLTEPGNLARVTGDIAMSMVAEGAPPSGSLEMYLDAGSALWTFAGVTPPHAGQLAVNARIRAAQDWL